PGDTHPISLSLSGLPPHPPPPLFPSTPPSRPHRGARCPGGRIQPEGWQDVVPGERAEGEGRRLNAIGVQVPYRATVDLGRHRSKSEEHTSELQSRFDLVCRLLLEKKKQEHARS